MSTDDALIDEICAELQQLRTELERVKAVSEEISGNDRLENQSTEKIQGCVTPP